jgi:adenine-specific DNA methylase
MLAKLTYKLISEIGVKEKYVRKDHYNTVKVWWARRPVSTMRSLLIREMLHRNNEVDHFVDAQLFSEINPPQSNFKSFQEQYKTNQLSVLDVFAGGGSIPFESARLGFKTFSSELNPVASLLQETIFNSVSIENYGEKLRKSGYNVIERVERRIGKYFSIDGIKPYVIFWSKVAKCKSCGCDLDLRRIEYLSKRKSKPLRIVEVDGTLRLENSFDKEERLQKEFTCKECGTKNFFKDVKEFCKENKFKFSAFAMCYNSGGKKYKIVSDNEKAILNVYATEIINEIQILSPLLPYGNVKLKSGVINPTLYDLKKPQDFFSERQLLVLLTVIDEITKEYPSLINSFGETEAKQIVLGLTSLIEFLVDWNSVSTMWISQNEQTGRSLAGPGVGMKWDFIEVNPFSGNGSNLKSKIDRVCDTFKAIKFETQVNILKGSSTNLKLKDKSIDIVLTDPPYYDSIDYTGLSEFFRPWFEVLISKTFSENINLKNQDEFEAIVELSKKSLKDHDHYQSIMTGVLSEVNRVLKDDGSALMLYSHKTFEGWKVIADSFLSSKLFVSDCIPAEMERIARPRAMAYDALNGVITFRLLKSNEGIKTIADDISDLKSMLSSGELLDSQIVIYLAALAVKQVSLTGKSYELAYDEVIKTHEKIRLENWINGRMDLITKSYLEAKLKGTLNGLENSYFEVLKENDLILDSRLRTMDEISLTEKTKNTILESAVLIYNDFKFNSKTKVSFGIEQKDSLMAFYSIVGGVQLNTVSKRSSTNETKVARLVLSKVH